jgi:hypothetical protein
MSDIGTLIGFGSLLANIAILALNLKLYTEILKEGAQQRRAERARTEVKS